MSYPYYGFFYVLIELPLCITFSDFSALQSTSDPNFTGYSPHAEKLMVEQKNPYTYYGFLYVLAELPLRIPFSVFNAIAFNADLNFVGWNPDREGITANFFSSLLPALRPWQEVAAAVVPFGEQAAATAFCAIYLRLPWLSPNQSPVDRPGD